MKLSEKELIDSAIEINSIMLKDAPMADVRSALEKAIGTLAVAPFLVEFLDRFVPTYIGEATMTAAFLEALPPAADDYVRYVCAAAVFVYETGRDLDEHVAAALCIAYEDEDEGDGAPFPRLVPPWVRRRRNDLTL